MKYVYREMRSYGARLSCIPLDVVVPVQAGEE